MVAAPELRGLCFTGQLDGRPADPRGRDAIGPELLVALEMGGKNMCVVLDDCALRQAVHEVAVGGYLSAGQRCTGTDRVLVHRKIADRFIDALAKAVARAAVRQPRGRDVCSRVRSPRTARSTKLEGAIEAAKKAGAEADRRRARARPGGYYRIGVAAPAARRHASRRRLHRSSRCSGRISASR